MNHDKETVEAAERYAENICKQAGVENDADLPMRKDFLAGVAYARERQGEEIAKLKARLERAKKFSDVIQKESNEMGLVLVEYANNQPWELDELANFIGRRFKNIKNALKELEE